MIRYLLDTTTLIDFSKGIEPVTSRLRALIAGITSDIGVCAIVVAEFFSGVAPADRPRWQLFFDTLTYWDMPVEVASLAGEQRYDFARQGTQLTTADTLISATALYHGLTIFTDNARHYPMPDVPLLSLRSPAPPATPS